MICYSYKSGDKIVIIKDQWGNGLPLYKVLTFKAYNRFNSPNPISSNFPNTDLLYVMELNTSILVRHTIPFTIFESKLFKALNDDT